MPMKIPNFYYNHSPQNRLCCYYVVFVFVIGNRFFAHLRGSGRISKPFNIRKFCNVRGTPGGYVLPVHRGYPSLWPQVLSGGHQSLVPGPFHGRECPRILSLVLSKVLSQRVSPVRIGVVSGIDRVPLNRT